MSSFHEWSTPIEVRTPLGDAEALGILDYGYNVNTVWLCRGDVVIYGNPMSRGGWDVDEPR